MEKLRKNKRVHFLWDTVYYLPVEPKIEPGHDDNKDGWSVELKHVISKRTIFESIIVD